MDRRTALKLIPVILGGFAQSVFASSPALKEKGESGDGTTKYWVSNVIIDTEGLDVRLRHKGKEKIVNLEEVWDAL